jgi:hypothetical protein
MVFAGAASLPAPRAAADWQDAHPYASTTLIYDTNLLRRDLDQPGVGDEDPAESDLYTRLEAGFNADLDRGRNRYLIDGFAYRNIYDNFGYLNHGSGRARARWLFNQEQRWFGDLGYVFDRRMRDFSNQIDPIRDFRTERRPFGTLSRWVGERARVEIGVADADIDYHQNNALDLNRRSATIAGIYETDLGNTVRIQIEHIDGSFAQVPEQEVEPETVRDFTETRTGPLLQWQVTAQTRIDAQFGYTKREHDNPSRPDYSGFTGRLTMIRGEASADNRLNLSVYRDVSSLGDEIANYAVVDGLSIEPSWRLTPKTSLRVTAAFEDRNFRGLRDELESNTDLGIRTDRVYSAGIWADWAATDVFALTVGYNAERRSSSRPLRDYEFGHLEVQFRAGL